MRPTPIITAVVLVVLAAAPAGAKNKHWHEHHREDDGGPDCYFRQQDVRILREYYEPRSRALPPGLAKKYYRTGHLPPGWEKKIEPIPVEVDHRLIVLPADYRRGYVDGSIIVYSPRTQVVIDVVGVFTR